MSNVFTPAIRLLPAICVALLTACGGGGGSPANEAPTAEAGAALSVGKHVAVTLNGAGSSDPEGRPLSFEWTQTAGVAVVLDDATAVQPAFVAPGVGSVLAFSLVVSDGKADSPSDTVTITVENGAPVPRAGTNVAVGTSSVVTLDGRGSTDPDGDALTLSWSQKSGPVVVVTQYPNGTMSFVTPAGTAILEFTLAASDGETTLSDDVVVVAQLAASNQSPVADAGTDDTVPRRSVTTLWGQAYDPENSSLSYQWTQTAGLPVTLNNPTSLYPTFDAPATATDLQFTLVASDGVLESPPDTVTIQVRNFPPQITQIGLTPDAPMTLDDLLATVSVEDPDQDPVTLAYEWQRNGTVLAGQTGASLPDDQHVRNDSITVLVSATDGEEQEFGQASVVIADAPAVLSGTAPTSIEHGALFTFQVTASDPDGDPVDALLVDHGPAGMTVDGDGTVNWTVHDPMFDRTMDFNWRIGMTGQPGAYLEGTVTVTDDDRKYPLRRTGIEIPVYHSGLVVADLDDDGGADILVGSSNAVYELGKQGSGYAQEWMYPFVSEIAAVTAADDDGDDHHEIWFSSRQMVVRLDGVHRRESARTAASFAAGCVDLEAGDLDSDGNLELVCLGTIESYSNMMTLIVLDAETLTVEWQSAELVLGSTMALGNVDADAALEIVTAGGFVYDGATFQNQWVYGEGFGRHVDTGDLDGDGIEEIVGALDWNSFRGFDAVLKSPVWIKAASDLDAIWVGNIDADPEAEILIGDGQWGNVTAWNYQTGTNSVVQAWQINSQDHGVTSIGVGDVDGDGALEFVWGSGASSSGEDHFVVAGHNPGIAVEWTNDDPNELDGPFLGARFARIGGGASRVMFLAPGTDNGYGGSRLVGLDYTTGLLSVSSEIGSNWANAGALAIADYDQDGVDEVLLATASLYDGYFTGWDFAANAAEWTSATGIGTGRAIVSGDMNNDSHEDMVVMGHDGRIHVFDLENQALIWSSSGSGGNGGQDVAVADLDDDGVLEIIATLGARVVAYRKVGGPVGYVESASFGMSAPRDVEVADTDGDGEPEILVLGTYPLVSAFNVVRLDADLQWLNSFAAPSYPASLAVEDLGGDRRNLLLSTGEISYFSDIPSRIIAVDAETGRTVWSSPVLGNSAVNLNSLTYLDADGDGDREIAFGTRSGMFVTR